MYISKRGPQFVLVATLLLLMLSPLRCATMPSARGEQREACRKASCTYTYLFLQWRGKYNDLVSVYRNSTVDVSRKQKNANSLLRLQSDVSRPESEDEGRLYINIYNERAKRYICFSRSGKVRTRRFLPSRDDGDLMCRFKETLVPSKRSTRGSKRSTPLYMYEVDEQRRKKRVITFCHKQAATLRRLAVLRRPERIARRRDVRRRRQRQQRQQRQQSAGQQRQRSAGRQQGARLRHQDARLRHQDAQRQRGSPGRTRHGHRLRRAAHQPKRNRHRCEYKFMKVEA